jgi:hypothetical protein
VVGDHAALDDDGVYGRPVDGGHLQRHAAVVDEDALARRDVVGQPGVGGAAAGAVAFDLLDGDGELIAAFKKYRPFAEPAEANLRALKIGEYAHGAARLLRGSAHPVVTLLVLGVRAMAHVEPGHVHPGVDERLDLLVRMAGGAQCADDPCAAHATSLGLTHR